MKKFLTILAAVLLTMAFATGAMAKKANEAPDSVVIKAAQAKQPAVTMPHKAHIDQGVSCETCHHTNKGLTKDSKDEVPTCTSCHLNPKDAATPNMAEMSMKKNPFHMGCVDCHKEKAKGPTKCADCHKK